MIKHDKYKYDPIVSLTGLNDIERSNDLIVTETGRQNLNKSGAYTSPPRPNEKILKESPRNRAKRLGLPYPDPDVDSHSDQAAGKTNGEGQEEGSGANSSSSLTPQKGVYYCSALHVVCGVADA